MGRRGFGVACFADIADDLSFFHAFIQADAGEFVEVGIVVPCARPLDADDFATQSVAPDFGTIPGVVLRIGVFFLAKISTPSCLRPWLRAAPQVSSKRLPLTGFGRLCSTGGCCALNCSISAVGRGSCLVVQPANKTTAALINKVFTAFSASNRSPCCSDGLVKKVF